MTVQIMVVEDEMIVAKDIQNRLRNFGYAVPAIASSGEEAIEKASEIQPDLVLMDIMLNGSMDGVETAKQIRERFDIPVVYLTAFADDSTLQRAKITEPFGYILKPFEERELYTTIEMALYKHKMERRLKESEQWFKTTLRCIGEAVIATNRERIITFMNPVAEVLTGWKQEEALGKYLLEVFNLTDELNHPLNETPVTRSFRQNSSVSFSNYTLRAKDGTERSIDTNTAPIRDDKGQIAGVVMVFRDITEKKKLAAQFLRTQRMDSIGTLAGGIAHDLNNVLAPILMSVQILRKRIIDERSQHVLTTLEASAQRGADMVKQVLSFARGIEGECVVLQPKHLIVDIQRMMNETFPKSIQIETSVPGNLMTVVGDATQLYQVLMNLCVNARDAMPNGGKLLIQAENLFIDENYAQMHMAAKPGRYVMIQVTDTGIGIAPHLIDKIFEPFFTTKEIGKGTGLGLSTALGIVKSHEGFIDVKSREGKGTTFKIYLPASESAQASPSWQKQEELPIGNGELIFVVDDEAPIRQITRSTLEAYGYEVITADDGAEAVALYAENRQKIKAVLMDMMMPYMDGLAAIRALQKLNPQVRIIAASGLMTASNASEVTSANVKAFLPKPYTAEKLLKVLAETLRN